MSNVTDNIDERKTKRYSHNFDIHRVQNYFPRVYQVIKVFSSLESILLLTFCFSLVQKRILLIQPN